MAEPTDYTLAYDIDEGSGSTLTNKGSVGSAGDLTISPAPGSGGPTWQAGPGSGLDADVLRWTGPASSQVAAVSGLTDPGGTATGTLAIRCTIVESGTLDRHVYLGFGRHGVSHWEIYRFDADIWVGIAAGGFDEVEGNNTATTFDDGDLHWIVGVATGAEFQLWVDGTEIAADGSGDIVAGVDLTFFGIGYDNDDAVSGARALAGDVAAVRVYDRALTSTEIGELGNVAVDPHEVAATIPLELDAVAVTGADHEVSAATIALAIDHTATAGTDHHAAATVPLELAATATAAADYQAAAGIDLTLDLDAATATDHTSAAAIPLTLDTDATAEADHQAAAAIPLTVDVDTATQADHQAAAAIDLTLDVAARTGEPTLIAVFVETARRDRWIGSIRGTPFAGATATVDRWHGSIRGSPWAGATSRPTRHGGAIALPDRWHGTIRPRQFLVTEIWREGEDMPLVTVDIGPYTENEVPEALVIRWLRTHADESTSGLPLHGQTPAWTVTAYITKPSGGAAIQRAVEILDPATLETEFPDLADQGPPNGVTNGDDGWLLMPFAAGDLDEPTGAEAYQIQLVADNGELLLKSQDVWAPEVVAGAASAAVLA